MEYDSDTRGCLDRRLSAFVYSLSEIAQPVTALFGAYSLLYEEHPMLQSLTSISEPTFQKLIISTSVLMALITSHIIRRRIANEALDHGFIPKLDPLIKRELMRRENKSSSLK